MISMQVNLTGFLPGEECKICKGRCCREHGCALAPQDMLRALGCSEDQVTREKVLQLLNNENGLYAIDIFQNAAGTMYYLRMRHKCYTFIGIDAIGECIALTKEGCSLSFEERPLGGRALKSSPDFHCNQEYTAAMMTADWAPYQEMLGQIWKEYERKFNEDGTFEACDRAYFDWLKAQRAASMPAK